MSEIAETLLWVEKYRPKDINGDELVLKESYRKKFQEYVSKSEIPNMLLVGSPGTGKSTIARILVDNLILDNSDILLLNGSTDRGIGIVRETIEPFLRIPPSKSKHKIVYIEEGDQLTPDAQKSLRAIIETYHDIGRFLITANYMNQFDPAILSRLDTYKFDAMEQQGVIDLYGHILKSEGIEFDIDQLKKVINVSYPDIRKGINMIQKLSSNSKLNLNNLNDIMDNSDKLVYETVNVIGSSSSIDNLNLGHITAFLNSDDLDLKSVLNKLFSHKAFSLPVKTTINKYANNMNSCISLEMHFISMIYEAKLADERFSGILNIR